MAGIRGKDTKPETSVRNALHRRGYRYRLHNPKLPGKPDLAFTSRKAVIMVHGCFWHGHGCNLFKWPSTREQFWRKKINRNRDRDSEIQQAFGVFRMAHSGRMGVCVEGQDKETI